MYQSYILEMIMQLNPIPTDVLVLSTEEPKEPDGSPISRPTCEADPLDLRTVLLALAADAKRDVKTIADILKVIDAHPFLIDLPRVLQGLLNALDTMDVPPALNLGNFDLLIWRDECRWLIANRSNPKFIARLGSDFYLGDKRRERNPVIGKGVKEFAFPYATLWHEPTDSESGQDYYRLIGQLLALYQQNANDVDLEDQEYNASLDLRELSGRRILTIPAELNIWSSSAIFLQSCWYFDAADSIYQLAEHFTRVARLVRYYGGKALPERHGGGGGQRRGELSLAAGQGVLISQGISEFPLEDPDDPDLLPGYISFVAAPPAVNDFDEELPLGEITAQREICLIDTGDEVRPFVAELLSHQGMLAHIARARQFLPFGYSCFTLRELATLLFGVSDDFQRCRERLRITPLHEQKATRLRLEALLALHLMLWFGRTIEDCTKLRISDRTARPTTVLELIPAGETTAEFRFYAPTPDYLAEEELPKAAVRLTQETISVPDLVGAAGLVMALGGVASARRGGVFTCKVADLEREIRVVLNELGDGDSRFTIHKVRSYLHRQIIADSHDVVAASMLSGVPCLSANTPLYYSQYDSTYLRTVYCRSVRRVLVGVYACVGLEALIPDVSEVAGAAVGARNCLRLDAVRANLAALLAVLRKRPRNDLRQLVHWHNCLTLWTVQMFLMATGCRAIRNPLKLVDEFDSRWGHGALGDKGADDGHMSRLAILPDLLARQLRAYDAHCVAIVERLKAHLPGQSVPTFGFFLRLTGNETLLFDEIRPRHVSEVMRQVEGYTPHPMNAFRKLVRTELAERGCPPETLAAYMGHWLQGEEPQDIFSSFCPHTYVDSLQRYLLPMMKELGWMVRNSHLVQEADA